VYEQISYKDIGPTIETIEFLKKAAQLG
jgi:hypothetical protein